MSGYRLHLAEQLTSDRLAGASTRSTAPFWMGTAFLGSAGVAALVLATQGADRDGLMQALRATARWSFLWFCPAYAGSAAKTLLGPSSAGLARRGREFGLAFAAALLVHVGLIVWFYCLTGYSPLGRLLSAFFGLGVLWTYALALFSIRRLSQALGPVRWRAARMIGLDYIMLAFLVDFIHPIASVRDAVEYIPFAALAGLAVALRLLAPVWRRLPPA